MNNYIKIILVSVLLSSCASQKQAELKNSSFSPRQMMIDLQGGEPVQPDPKELEKYPLGSAHNPIRVDGVMGERSYLISLSCHDNSSPSFKRAGSVGIGPYGFILDLYEVECVNNPESKKHSIYMDLYHPGYIENRAVPGFGIINTNPIATP